MDPLTASLAFATIVQLLGIFKSERKDQMDTDHQEFIDWLDYHRHEDIKSLIVNTAAIQSEIDNLLRQDYETILAKLDSMDRVLMDLCSKIDTFSGLANAMPAETLLSDQAVSVLRQLVQSAGSSFFRLRQLGSGPSYHLEQGGEIKITEPRFIEDDLQQLESLGLLICYSDNNNEPNYRITRNADRLVKAMDGSFS